jgi:hypothetical protein
MSYQPHHRAVAMAAYFSEYTHGIEGDIEIMQKVRDATPEKIEEVYSSLLPWYEFGVIDGQISVKRKTNEPVYPLIRAMIAAFKPEFIVLTKTKKG